MRWCTVPLITLVSASGGLAAQDTDTLQAGERVRVTTTTGLRHEGPLLDTWLPDSLRLYASLSRRAFTFTGDALRRVEVARGHHGDTGALVGLIVGVGAGIVGGVTLVQALAEGDVSPGTYVAASALSSLVTVTVAVPVFGVIGSAMPRWRRVR